MYEKLTRGTVLFIVMIGFVAFLVLYNTSCADKPRAKPAQVAAIINLTGPAARFDAIKQKTLAVALERVKVIHPEIQMDLKVLDAGGGPEATTVAVRRALNDGALYFLSGTSPTALAIATQVRDHSPAVVQMANAANPDFGPPRAGEYRFWPDWKQEAEIVLEVLKNEQIASILLIHSADPYSEALKKELKAQTNAITGFTMRELQYDPAATPDFRPAMLRAKEEGTQAIVIFGLPPGIRALISQMAEVSWDKALIGGVNINLAVGDYDAAGLTGGLWLIETEAMKENLPAGTEAASYRSAYKQAHGENPPFHALYLADALYFIAAAWTNANDLNLSEVERVKRVKDFESASGHIKVNNDGTLLFVMSARKVR